LEWLRNNNGIGFFRWSVTIAKLRYTRINEIDVLNVRQRR
jgi:hypothetical protein